MYAAIASVLEAEELAERRTGEDHRRVEVHLTVRGRRHTKAARAARLESPQPPFSTRRHGAQLAGSARYRGRVSSQRVPGGVVHHLPADLRKALIANTEALDAWNDITPLARNEFICWVEDAKQEKTRDRRIRRTQEELSDGQRRPCCWPGCAHRERTGS